MHTLYIYTHTHTYIQDTYIHIYTYIHMYNIHYKGYMGIVGVPTMSEGIMQALQELGSNIVQGRFRRNFWIRFAGFGYEV